MRGQFTKYKFTTGLFYKSIEIADFKLLDDCLEIKIIPYFNYSAKYFIHSIAKKQVGRKIFNVYKADFDINSIDEIDFPNKCYLTIYKDFKKIAIFDSNKNGIILKK